MKLRLSWVLDNREILMDIVLMVHVKMEIGEISTDRTYVIVNLGDKKFIFTLR